MSEDFEAVLQLLPEDLFTLLLEQKYGDLYYPCLSMSPEYQISGLYKV